VDQHVEVLAISCRGPEDVVIAGQLARRKALKPKEISLDDDGTVSSLSALSALLADEQHHPMFEHVQQLTFQGRFA
jgi:hypothetical protein